MTDLAAGRTNQKLRTRQALIDAVNRLLAGGATPTFEEVAEAAMVSRATAYRYFRSLDELMADAFFERRLAGREETFARVSDDPAERLFAAEAAVNGVLMENERAMHLMARSFIDQWLDEAHQGDSSRPGRRLSLIDAALETLHEVPPQARRRLRNAAALAIGMEAVISLRDVCGLDRREARATARWALEAMVARALSKK